MMLMIVLVAGNITTVRRVLATNSRTSLVNPTVMIRIEVLADILDVQIPVVVTDIHLRTLVYQIPANIVKIAFGLRRLNRQRKITTTQTLALFALTIILGHNYTSKSYSKNPIRAWILRPSGSPVN